MSFVVDTVFTMEYFLSLFFLSLFLPPFLSPFVEFLFVWRKCLKCKGDFKMERTKKELHTFYFL
jgi:hypothetical protein